MTKRQNLELIYLKCKESIEDVPGWKVFIFLQQCFTWRLLIMVTVVLTYVLRTTEFFFELDIPYYDLMELVFNSLYFVDTMSYMLHIMMARTRQLRHGRKKHLVYLLLDWVSLLPFGLFHDLFIFLDKQRVGGIMKDFRLNVCLRIYQVFTFFRETRFWTYQMKVLSIVTVARTILYLSLLTHIFACLHFYLADDEKKGVCKEDMFICIVEGEMLIFSTLFENYSKKNFVFPIDRKTLFSAFTLLFGFFAIYAYVLPMTVFAVFFWLLQFIDYAIKMHQLKMLLHNLIGDQTIGVNLRNYFQMIWIFGKGRDRPPIMNVFPLDLTKSIFCDIHWDAFRHSEFLSDLSMGCKRALGMSMMTDFVLPETILIDINQTKLNFLYIESGLVHIMADENAESPVISFLGGTVLGEMSLFYQLNSSAILKVGKLSVIHTMSHDDFLRVLMDYPRDRRKLLNKLNYRLTVARATHTRKFQIVTKFVEDANERVSMMRGDVKWIKQQFRALLALHKDYKNTEERTAEGQMNLVLHELNTQADHTSAFLSLLNINNEDVNQYDVVCLSTRCPWLIDPQSSFLRLWNILVSLFTASTFLVYPAFMGWYPILPIWFFNYTILVTFMFIVDLIITMFTAIRVKNIRITSMEKIIAQKFSSLRFYADFVAAIPVQVLALMSNLDKKPYRMNVTLLNTFVKSYKLFVIISEWNYYGESKPFLKTVLKVLTFFILTMYWLAMLFKLTGIECIFYDCGDRDWFSRIKETPHEYPDYLSSLIITLQLGLDLPFTTFQTNVLASLIIYFFFYVWFRINFLVFRAETLTAFALDKYYSVFYMSLIQIVERYMRQEKIGGRIPLRVTNTMKFQFSYDGGNFLTEENRIVDSIPANLRTQLDRETLYKTLKSCPLFSMEDDDYILELASKAQHIALPSNSVLITFGKQTMNLYIIHKGFVQLNSFLGRDVVKSIGTPVILKSGDIFPIIVALKQIPSSVTARTMTDCELLTLNLEDILTQMEVYGCLKDVVDSLKEIDMSGVTKARPGLSIIVDDLKGYGGMLDFNTFMDVLLFRRVIDNEGTFYLYWEVFRVVCIVFGLLYWPILTGSLVYDKTDLAFYILAGVDSTIILDFFIRIRVSFYNEKGLYISHPLKTFIHYMTTNFTVDVFQWLAFIHNVYTAIIFRTKFKFGEGVIIMAFRFLSWYRVAGLIAYLRSTNIVGYEVEILNFSLAGVVLIHFFTNIMTYHELTDFRDPSSPLVEVYYRNALRVINYLIKGNYPIIRTRTRTVVVGLTFIIAGWAAEILLYGLVLLRSMSMREHFARYMYYLRSFKSYLKFEKIEDKFIEEAVNHYEFIWKNQQGIEYKLLFSRFPNNLREDIMFSMYKSTFALVSCFSKANESFYRTLSVNVEEEFLSKGSTILFEKQVNNMVFFVYKGACQVSGSTANLCRGSMFGDIHRQSVVTNTFMAKTHVRLLKIDSDIFFMTLNNYIQTRAAYEREVTRYDDYVDSICYDIFMDDTKDVVSRTEQPSEVYLESIFEPISDSGLGAKRSKLKVPKSDKRDGALMGFLDPTTRTSYLFRVTFFINCFTTIVLMPVIIGLRSRTPQILTIIYTMDLIHVLKILYYLSAGVVDHKTGIVSYNKRIIFKNYLFQIHGLVVDVLSVLPIELIYFTYYWVTGYEDNCSMCCYTLRLLRIFYVVQIIRIEEKKLSPTFIVRFLVANIFIFTYISIIICMLMLTLMKTSSSCYTKITDEQWEKLKYSTVCAISYFCGNGKEMCPKRTTWMRTLLTITAILGIVAKVHLCMKSVEILMYHLKDKYEQIMQLEELENYLTVRDISPALLTNIKKYLIELIDFCQEGAMPRFLQESPHHVKLHIMSDLYQHHLANCYLFRDLDSSFLAQLSTRLERFVFFPGMSITRQGDVDNNIYFIQRGEVECLERDKDYPLLERTTSIYYENESFGMEQGIFRQCPHDYGHRAKILCVILVLNFHNWLDMRTAYPNISEVILKRALEMRTTAKKKV